MKNKTLEVIKTHKKEAFLLDRLRHKNIVTMLGLVVTDTETWIVTDFASFGNLEGFSQFLEDMHYNHINPVTGVQDNEGLGFC